MSNAPKLTTAKRIEKPLPRLTEPDAKPDDGERVLREYMAARSDARPTFEERKASWDHAIREVLKASTTGVGYLYPWLVLVTGGCLLFASTHVRSDVNNIQGLFVCVLLGVGMVCTGLLLLGMRRGQS